MALNDGAASKHVQVSAAVVQRENSYLNGKVYIVQPYKYAQMHSTENRLIATTSDICDWDNTIYEEQCFYFNTVTRHLHYPHGVKGAGLDGNYGCAAEATILRQYFQRFDR